VVFRSGYVSTGAGALAYRVDDTAHDAMQEVVATYSPVLGPVRKVITYLPSSGSMPVYVGHCEYYDLDYVLQGIMGQSSLDTGVKTSMFAGGKGYDTHAMFVSSLGETVERVLGSLHYFGTIDEHVYGTYRELTARGLRCLSPTEMPLFSPEQHAEPGFLFEPFTEDSMLGWIEGQRLLSGEKIWVPGQLVELVYSRRADEAIIGYAVSGGLSSHVSREQALFHGITELIERDAVNLRWYCGLAPERVVLDRPLERPELMKLLRNASDLPGEVVMYNHAVDIPEVPVITAIEVDPWLNRYSYYSGGGADTDIEVALTKALTEFGQSERMIRMSLTAPDSSFARTVSRQFEMGADDDVSKIDLFFKVVSFYGYKANVGRLDWYLKGGGEVALSDLPVVLGNATEKYEHIREVLRTHELDPIVFDCTPSAMNHVALLKVFLPELTQPFIQSLPIFGHPRFAAAGQMLGKTTEPIGFADLVTDPLPYP
jgi:ribosomal protein S12 methylthiotransferase accessory factor